MGEWDLVSRSIVGKWVYYEKCREVEVSINSGFLWGFLVGENLGFKI